jgi:hypothetical protein
MLVKTPLPAADGWEAKFSMLLVASPRQQKTEIDRNENHQKGRFGTERASHDGTLDPHMRLAFLVLDGGLGGHTRTAVAIAEGFRARGHEITFLLGRASKEDVVAKAGFKFEKIDHGFKTGLTAALDRLKPDALHTFSTLGLTEAIQYGKQKNLGVVYTRCGGPPVKEPLEVKMMKALKLRRLTCLSVENRAELLEKSAARPEDILVLPARIDVKAFRDRQETGKWDAFRQRFSLGDAPILLRIARIGPAYEDTIRMGIEAAQQLNAEGVRMVFVHIGYADVPTIAESIYAQVKSANEAAGKVIAVSDAEVSKDAQSHVGMASAVVGMGRSAFEGMASGRPTLVVGKVGFGGLVLPDRVETLAAFNFSGRDGNAPATREESLSQLVATVRRLLTEPDFAKTAGDFAAKYTDETLDVRHSLDAYERLYADHDPAQWPADGEIKAAMKFAIIKRSMREMIPRSLRAQISGLINLRKKASVPE